MQFLQGMLVLRATRGGAAWEISPSGKPATALPTVPVASSDSCARAGAAGGGAVDWTRDIKKICPGRRLTPPKKKLAVCSFG